ncbi:MAG: retropepsin-like aspartic protease [bacterium]|nr:retropepsin-like aspartic protease [bacterium]
MKSYTTIILLLLTILCSGCSGCSKSGRKQRSQVRNNEAGRSLEENIRNDRTVIKMQKANGVYHIPFEINGIPMYFIFDTGAGLISISETEAIFLYKQGRLSDDDFQGTMNFIDANGDISEGTILNHESVKIGNTTLNNIQGSVVHNLEAPLLFGQSALEKFGKVSIDYQREEISFE